MVLKGKKLQKIQKVSEKGVSDIFCIKWDVKLLHIL